jgi:RNase P subunit RPR2
MIFLLIQKILTRYYYKIKEKINKIKKMEVIKLMVRVVCKDCGKEFFLTQSDFIERVENKKKVICDNCKKQK